MQRQDRAANSLHPLGGDHAKDYRLNHTEELPWLNW